MKVTVFDIECNGLDTETVDVHCVVIHDVDTGHVFRHGPDQLAGAVRVLNARMDEGYVLAGHNVIEYDIPILRRFGLKEPAKVLDTLVMSRAAYPGSTLYGKDQAFLSRKPELREVMRPGAHSLKAWGLRLGEPKEDYEGGWDEFNEEMLSYCVQDVATNVKLLALLRERIPDEASLLECEVATICRRMRLFGVGFDVAKAEQLTLQLAARRFELTGTLREAFGEWIESTGIKTPKRTQNRKHVELIEGELVEVDRMEKGVPYETGKLVQFNPASTEHIAKRLQDKYGWKPRHYTDGGKPQVTADVLHDLTYLEAPLLAEYQEIKKVLGYIAEGTNAWLRLERDGRLHGKVNPTGTVTSRAAHSSPNTGNVPSRSELGHHCRALFVAKGDNVIVGADASGLQLRGLAHYLAKWDGGAFARQCEDGDIHEYMRQATGLYTRARQKTWTYAKLFGAGKVKLGQTAILDWRDANEQGITEEPAPKQGAAARLGQATLDNLGDAIPAFTELERDLKLAAGRGNLKALDGRTLPISSEHIAIAVLLQSFEACVMKRAMTLAAPHIYRLQSEFVLWVHDEFQAEAPRNMADHVGEVMVWAMKQAGIDFGLRVRIDGEYKVGRTWAETH